MEAGNNNNIIQQPVLNNISSINIQCLLKRGECEALACGENYWIHFERLVVSRRPTAEE